MIRIAKPSPADIAGILQQINQHRRYRVTVPERFRSVAMFIEDAD